VAIQRAETATSAARTSIAHDTFIVGIALAAGRASAGTPGGGESDLMRHPNPDRPGMRGDSRRRYQAASACTHSGACSANRQASPPSNRMSPALGRRGRAHPLRSKQRTSFVQKIAVRVKKPITSRSGAPSTE
jgi:hypothetical protein